MAKKYQLALQALYLKSSDMAIAKNEGWGIAAKRLKQAASLNGRRIQRPHQVSLDVGVFIQSMFQTGGLKFCTKKSN